MTETEYKIRHHESAILRLFPQNGCNAFVIRQDEEFHVSGYVAVDNRPAIYLQEMIVTEYGKTAITARIGNWSEEKQKRLLGLLKTVEPGEWWQV